MDLTSFSLGVVAGVIAYFVAQAIFVVVLVRRKYRSLLPLVGLRSRKANMRMQRGDHAPRAEADEDDYLIPRQEGLNA